MVVVVAVIEMVVLLVRVQVRRSVESKDEVRMRL